MLRALVLNCTLKPSPAESSSDVLAGQVLDALAKYDVHGESIRVVDHDVKPGVEADMGDGDEWPLIRGRVLASDILVFATPTWMGHMSSVAQRVLERLDAEISETDDEGRPIIAGKVAVAVVVGNEDGAHAIIADLFQGLNDVGFTVPSQGGVYWNGEAMQSTDYKDLPETPEKVASTTETLARHAAHLAKLLKERPYPAPAS
ncbi:MULTISPECIES: NAD(P)H-dependent oxidoreductase [unclassified Microbacterium]|uniref:flavodoxin family protein n=1 Tax=unclassified Microbacterium TaxID=2609290 RepID=UPI00214CC9AA|nr:MULTISPECIES: NAD(P)H-dependent oxidoreductase [unclassified Microbacterium]MCR2783888.1 NAD(P)H-dependent oxidoreductase [Microbacterium sp. zg.B96]MDL5351320.1 NAD(P)H-dependent oxidoreductase [Microbacterium sp. zg-YB36]WIM15266.1 NAD(P)H-dependent oxidoreductase [Microbacterium sp. zg-B96]